jgi:RimJ/RimL family protein N-acetyltransferase
MLKELLTKLDRSKTKSPQQMENDSRLIKSFYEQLDEELLNFSLPVDTLIQTYDFIEYKSINGIIAGIGGLRGGNYLFLITKGAYQGRGLGQKLLQKVIQKAKKNNNSHIQLTVFKTNEAAIHIYEKYGFRKVSSIKVDGRDSYYMSMPLSFKGLFIILIKRFEVISKKFLLNYREKKELRQGQEGKQVKNRNS